MSTKNYNTKRNQEINFWTKPGYDPSILYDKVEMLQKVKALKDAKPKSAIWTSLASQLMLGKRLTYNQQSLIDTAYDRLKKEKVINRSKV